MLARGWEWVWGPPPCFQLDGSHHEHKKGKEYGGSSKTLNRKNTIPSNNHHLGYRAEEDKTRMAKRLMVPEG